MAKIERFILQQIRLENYVVTVHARKRMSERFISEADIVDVVNNLSSIEKQENNDTYLLKGNNSWGEKIGISVAVRKRVIIVTVFYEGDL